MGDDEPDGVWLKDDWYWRKEATDWGYYWAEGEAKKDHPQVSTFLPLRQGHNRWTQPRIFWMS